MRFSSVPLIPATGSDAMSEGRSVGSDHMVWRRATSALAVSRSSCERPEPSTIRTPASGIEASPSSFITTAAPAAEVPMFICTAPSSFSSISAVKLSLSRFIQRTIDCSAADSTEASVTASSPATPSVARPGTATPALRSAARNASAAASAGWREIVRP